MRIEEGPALCTFRCLLSAQFTSHVNVNIKQILPYDGLEPVRRMVIPAVGVYP